MNNNYKITNFSEFPEIDDVILNDIQNSLKEKYTDFVVGCLTHATEYFGGTLEGAAKRDAIRTQLKSHSLKAITGQLGAARFTQIVRVLEDEVLDIDPDDINWDNVDMLIDQIKLEFPQLIETFSKILKTHGTA